MTNILFSANVYRHLTSFHVPYMKLLIDKGYKVYAAANEDYGGNKKILDEIGVICIDIPFNRNPFSKDNWIAYKKLNGLFKTINFDLVHVHTPIAAFIVREAFSKFKRKNNGKLIYTAHGYHFFKGSSIKNWLLYFPLEFSQIKNTDILITTNKEDYKLSNDMKFNTNVEIVNGVGVENYIKLDEKQKKQLRNEMNITEENIVLFTAAEFNDNKNQWFLIKNWNEIKKEVPNAIALFAGEGPQRKILEEYCHENGLKDVYFLGFRRDVQNLLQISDIFFLLSKREGLPKSLMEAMLAEKPSVVTAIRGNIDLITDNKEGFLVELDNDLNLVNSFVSLMKSEELRMKFGKEARTKVVNFELDATIREMDNIYESILPKKVDGK